MHFIEARFMGHPANIGDTRTLIIHPASTTHRQLDAEQQLAPVCRQTWCACPWA